MFASQKQPDPSLVKTRIKAVNSTLTQMQKENQLKTHDFHI